MDNHICGYNFANQSVLKFATYHDIHGPLPHNMHLIIYAHACTREGATSPYGIHAACFAFSVGLFLALRSIAQPAPYLALPPRQHH